MHTPSSSDLRARCVGYTSTTKNIYYIDDATNVVKIGVHTLFDEAHFTSPRAKQPLAAQTLQVLGYSAFRDKFKNGVFTSKHRLKVTLVHRNAIAPERTSPTSAGFNNHTCFTTPIQPGESRNVPTGLRINIPANHYIEIVPMSPPPLAHCLVYPQVIDSTTNDDIHVTVKNTSTIPMVVTQGTNIAHMLYHKAIIHTITTKRVINEDTREIPSEKTMVTISNTTTDTIDSPPIEDSASSLDIIPYEDDELLSTPEDDNILPYVRNIRTTVNSKAITQPLDARYDSDSSDKATDCDSDDEDSIDYETDDDAPPILTQYESDSDSDLDDDDDHEDV